MGMIERRPPEERRPEILGRRAPAILQHLPSLPERRDKPPVSNQLPEVSGWGAKSATKSFVAEKEIQRERIGIARDMPREVPAMPRLNEQDFQGVAEGQKKSSTMTSSWLEASKPTSFERSHVDPEVRHPLAAPESGCHTTPQGDQVCRSVPAVPSSSESVVDLAAKAAFLDAIQERRKRAADKCRLTTLEAAKRGAFIGGVVGTLGAALTQKELAKGALAGAASCAAYTAMENLLNDKDCRESDKGREAGAQDTQKPQSEEKADGHQ